jgi:hypothetical protein
MSMSLLNPKDVVEANTAINQLQSALAADLAITVDDHSMVQVKIAASNGAQVTMHLLGHEIGEFISEFIQEKLAKLQILGVDTSGILENYKAAGEKVLQARNENGG